MHATVMIEVDATDFLSSDDENEPSTKDWLYCKQHATFVHLYACEFVFHVGTDGTNSDGYKDRLAHMTEHECSPGFINLYQRAAELGAVRVLFYA